MSPYQYTELNVERDEIRLLQLHTGAFEDDIYISIVHEPIPVPLAPEVAPTRSSFREVLATLPEDWTVFETLDGRYMFEYPHVTTWTHPVPGFDSSVLAPEGAPQFRTTYQYEALSYAWGSMENQDIVYVGTADDGFDTTLSIGTNLASALRHVRSLERTRTFWVDAICINQQDIQERNAQVKRISKIFALAERVMVWLGPETPETQLALSAITYFGSQVEVTEDGFSFPSPGALYPQWVHASVPFPFDETTGSALRTFFSQSWFARMWVMQEANLGGRRVMVQNGDEILPWAFLRKVIIVLNNKAGMGTSLSRALNCAYEIATTRHMRTLRRLFSSNRMLQCADPRDKIYAILGLAPKEFATMIEPDYSLPVDQVYMDAFYSYLKFSGRLDLLSLCKMDLKTHSGPSWVPDWEAQSDLYHYLSRGQSISGARGRIFGNTGRLQVYGKNCGSIDVVGRTASGDATQIVAAIRDWEPQNLLTSNYVNGEPLFEAFLKLICFESLNDLSSETRESVLHELKEEYLRSIYNNSSSCNERRFRHLHLGKLRNFSFFSTVNGHIGLTSAPVQMNDRVCFILGCDVPILLRSAGNDQFLVVGQGFVRGLMESEAFLGEIEHPWETQHEYDATIWVRRYFNRSTEELTTEDPRLGPLRWGWEATQEPRVTLEDLEIQTKFKNDRYHEHTTCDPRMHEDELRARGVDIEVFELI